jgi:O-antigen/teichoic acid export membrane protein
MLRNGFYNTVGAIARLAIGFLSIPLLIRLMGIEEYGLWVLASTTLSVVGIAEAGLSTSTTFFVSRDLAKQDSVEISETLSIVSAAMLLMATAAAIGLWFTAPELAQLFPSLQSAQQSTISLALRYGTLVLWTRLLQGIAIGVEQASERYGVMNTLITLQSLLTSLGMLATASLGGKTLALMQWQVLVGCTLLILHGCVSWRLLRCYQLRFRWNLAKGIKIVRYSTATWFTSLGSALFQNGDRLIVGNLLGVKLLGVYAAIIGVTAQINLLSAVTVQPLLPRLSQLSGSHDSNHANVQQKIKQSLQINAVVLLLISCSLLLFAQVIINILLGQNTAGGYLPEFRLAVIIYSIYSLNAVGYYMLLATGAATTSMVVVMLSGIASLLMIYVGASHFQLMGATLGNAGFIGVWSLTFFAMKRFRISFKQWSSWILLPIVYTVFISVLDYVFFPDANIIFKILLMALHVIGMLIWFSHQFSFSLKQAVRLLVLR